MTLLFDAGPLYACVDADDDHHAECLELLESHPGPLVVSMPVVTAAACLIGRRVGASAEVRFLGDFASGSFQPEPVAATDWMRIAELVAQSSDLPLGTADASVVAAAERRAVTEIATVDRRHFSVVRPNHTSSFTLLP